MVTTFRASPVFGVWGASTAPQALPNRAPAGLAEPQAGHRGASAAPQPLQKRAAAGLSCPQLAQITPCSRAAAHRSNGFGGTLLQRARVAVVEEHVPRRGAGIGRRRPV